MENDLIRRSDAFDAVDNYDGAYVADMLISDIPAVDAVEVVRGEWIDTPDKTNSICSYCKAEWNVFDNDTYRFNFCPNCGADMRQI